jgi:hypothetical protein
MGCLLCAGDCCCLCILLVMSWETSCVFTLYCMCSCALCICGEHVCRASYSTIHGGGKYRWNWFKSLYGIQYVMLVSYKLFLYIDCTVVYWQLYYQRFVVHLWQISSMDRNNRVVYILKNGRNSGIIRLYGLYIYTFSLLVYSLQAIIVSCGVAHALGTEYRCSWFLE